jgi:hypothetical protein
VTKRIGRNQSCPCGSGRKYKHCCLAAAQFQPRYTREDRDAALHKLEQLTEEILEHEDDVALDEFWVAVPSFEDYELADYVAQVGDEVCDWWFWFDRPLDGGRLPVDHILEHEGWALTDRERRYLELARESCLQLYEVVETVPGETVTLEDAISSERVTVVERTASRSLERGTLVAARVMPGPGTAPTVIEAGFLAFPNFAKRSMVEQTLERLQDHRTGDPRGHNAAFFKALAPALYQAWVQLRVEPPIPHLVNTDNEDLLWTTVRFAVQDAEQLTRTLDGLAELQRDDDEAPEWVWEVANAKGDLVGLGLLVLRDDELVLETNSRERGDRGRKLVESVAGGAVSFRLASHEDLSQSLGRVSGSVAGQTPADDEQIPADLAEELVLTQTALHYHHWLDEPVPALGGHTPREAAASRNLASDVERLIRELEGMYERSLREGMPAYDPSWMRHELGIAEAWSGQHPPPLAHERWAVALPGWNDACGKAAWAIRNRPGFDDNSSIAASEDLERDIDIQRLRRLPNTPVDLMTRLRYGVSFELHRRKVFWVDEALAFLLAKTDLDIDGGHLRAPFPAFAMVFTDRQTLSLAERLLAADSACPIRGYLLRAVTVYVIEEHGADETTMNLGFACDTRGADPPYFYEHQVRAVEGQRVVVAAPPQVEQVELGAAPKPTPALGSLLEITLNAILYAVSPASEKVPRLSPRTQSATARSGSSAVFASDDVFYLPGPIPISQTRQLERLDHVPSGRQVMTRFMVRGHWRRPNRSWKEQSMRWIKPYWKGPDIAAVIERTYRLEV